MKTRLYLVAGPKGDRLVDAYSKAQAIGHCVRTEYSAEVASQQALMAAFKAGIEVEIAGAEPTAAAADNEGGINVRA